MMYIALALSLLIPLCSAGQYVPVVLWTNIKRSECTPNISVYPGEPISVFTESLYFECLRSSHPGTVKVFVTDELDQVDLATSRHASGEGKAFHHLKATLTHHASLVMPAVIASSVPAFLQNRFTEDFGGESVVSVVDVGRIDRGSTESTRRSIMLIDEIINEDLLKMKANEKFVAVLVARSPPQPQLHVYEGADSHHGRQLLAVTEPFAPAAQQFVHWQTCIFMSYTNLSLTYRTDVYTLVEPKVERGYCSESSDNASIDVSFKVGNGSAESQSVVKLGLQFVKVLSKASAVTWWNVSSAVLNHSISGSDKSYKLRITDGYAYSAPSNWSWVCKKPQAMTWKDPKDSTNTQKLEFESIQLQPFGIVNGNFSRASDCSGFLSGPIWMGTVVSFLLLAIFTFGMMFMSAVTTMDRFDDPRGKPLSVNLQEGN